MAASAFCREDILSQDALYETLNILRRRVELACLDGDSAFQLVEALKIADRMVAGGNIPAAADAIDRFILMVQRLLGSHISLSKAFELVDIAILDFKRFIADSAQVFTEALTFSQRFYALNFAVDVSATLAARPIPAGVPETVRAMRETIRSYGIPADAEARLLGFVDQMGELALQFDPAPMDNKLNSVSRRPGALQGRDCWSSGPLYHRDPGQPPFRHHSVRGAGLAMRQPEGLDCSGRSAADRLLLIRSAPGQEGGGCGFGCHLLIPNAQAF